MVTKLYTNAEMSNCRPRTLIHDNDGDAYEKDEHFPGSEWWPVGSALTWKSAEICKPVTIVWSPDE